MKQISKIIVFIYVVFLTPALDNGVVFSSPALGADRKISNISVQGTKRIDPETVISYIKLRPGDLFNEGALNDALKVLYATGLFLDVQLGLSNGNLTILVAENPVVNRIVFEGNKRIESEELKKELQLKPRRVFTRTKVQQDIQRLLDIYALNGRFAVKIEPKLVKLDQNRVDLVFEVDEGAISRVRKISFIGNKRFSDSDLSDVIQTKEYAIWRFLTTDDTYDPDRLGFDGELLRRFYLNRGFIDFEVVSTVAELAPGKSDFLVTFTVKEGKRYKLGKISIESKVSSVKLDQLTKVARKLEGDWYSARSIDKTIENLTNVLGGLGFAFVDINPQIVRRKEGLLVDLVYNIAQTRQVYIERIDIEGNLRTLDEVVRREFDLMEGDAFNATKLRRARRSIQNLGFFAKTQVKNVAGSAEDKTIINVSVEEKSTGEISFGVGFSSLDGPLANIGVRERNLLGRGQDLNLNFQGSAARQEFNLGFTEPYFLGRDISAGVDFFQVTTDRQTASSFDERKSGGGLRLGYSLAPDLRQGLKYLYKRTRIRNVDDTASIFIKEQEGSNTVSQISHTTTLDKRDNKYNPSEGYVLSFTNEVAGLGGDTRHLRSKIKGGYYLPVLEDNVLTVIAESGYIIGMDDDVEIGERFFLGGQKVRGFSSSGIGPRDSNTKDALGGNKYYAGTIELMFPLGFADELGFKGSMFGDIGSLTELDRKSLQILDSSGLRASVGMGVSWATALGLMRLDFASAMLKEDWDETEFIRFSFGTRF